MPNTLMDLPLPFDHIDPTCADLKHIIDCKALQAIMDDFYRITKIGMALMDIDGNTLVSTGWQDICINFHRIHPESKKNCLESDIHLTNGVELGEFKLYKCKNNMWDIVTPIMLNERHLGNLFLGQFLFDDEKPDYELFRKQALHYGFDEQEYLAALERVPRWSHDTVQNVMSFYAKFAMVISGLGHKNLFLSKTLSERDALVHSLSNSESKFRHYLELAPMGISVNDSRGAYRYVNPVGTEISGYSNEEMMAMSILDIILPEDHEKVLNHLRSLVNMVSDVEVRIQTKTKQIKTVLVQAIKLDEDQVLCYVNDITERNQTLASLHYQQEIEHLMVGFSNQLINAGSDSFDGVITEYLSKFGELLGVGRVYVFKLDHEKDLVFNTHEWCKPGIDSQINNLQGVPCSFAPMWIAEMRAKRNVVIRNVAELSEKWQGEKDILLPQGIVSLLSAPIVYQNELHGFIGFDIVPNIRDWQEEEITAIRMMADLLAGAFERIKSEKELIKAKEKAEESSRLKSAFLATINHELRTPLNHIMGFAQLLEYDSDTSEAQSYATQIRQSGADLLKMIQDIFDLALAEQAQIQVRPQNFDFVQHYLENKQLLEEILASSGKEDVVELLYSPDQSIVHCEVIADLTKINQVLMNLFKNAVKFTPSGEIEFGVELISPELIRYYVRDTGIGIPKDKQKIIFDFFCQGDDSNTRIYGGVGIGLAISKSVTEIMGGKLILESVEMVGSTFILEIPVKIIHKDDVMSFSNGADLQIPDFSQFHILVVDDDIDSLFIIRNYLRKTSAVLYEAEDGLQAVEIFNANPQINLVIMDIQMPVMDGYAATKQIKALRPKVPVLALSAFALSMSDPVIRHTGFGSAISKPIKREILFEEIKRVNR